MISKEWIIPRESSELILIWRVIVLPDDMWLNRNFLRIPIINPIHFIKIEFHILLLSSCHCSTCHRHFKTTELETFYHSEISIFFFSFTFDTKSKRIIFISSHELVVAVEREHKSQLDCSSLVRPSLCIQDIREKLSVLVAFSPFRSDRKVGRFYLFVLTLGNRPISRRLYTNE